MSSPVVWSLMAGDWYFVFVCIRSVCVSWTCPCCASCGPSTRPSRTTKAPRSWLRPPSLLITDTLRRRRRMKWRGKMRRGQAFSHSLLLPCPCLCLHPAATPGTSGSRTPFIFPDEDADALWRHRDHLKVYYSYWPFSPHLRYFLCHAAPVFSLIHILILHFAKSVPV